MKLLQNEAYITKSNKIKLNDDPNVYCIFTNPIKGEFNKLEHRIYQILELNNLLILELSFSDGECIYLSQIGTDHDDKHEGVYVYYLSKEDAIGLKFNTATVSRAIEWNDITKKVYIDKDLCLRGVIVKGNR